MGKADRRIDVFLEKAGAWREELAALRAILLDGPLDEAFKWRQPCYTFEGANVAILWGFKAFCGVGFFKGVLMKDPEGVLAAPGENSRATRVLRFTGPDEIAAGEATLRAYVQEAVAVEKAGLKVAFAKDDLEWPEELIARLDTDPALREAFEALTPGRRRGYVLHVSQAKQPATRAARIEKWAPRILEGKGMHDR
jgi:uncharacterized protein YdeI (YjbR/CyaY-like superfamily)